jgi:predicted alpha/beta-fold hydrolase
MPIQNSNYSGPPFYLFNGHLETIIPSLFRKVEGVTYRREKILTIGSDRLLVLSHGLEGDSMRHYIMGLVKLFNSKGIDTLVWNNRSCGGEMNLKPILYHHGASYDLDTTINHVLRMNRYREMYLSGISMGGAQTLKYLGEKGLDLNPMIKRAAVYSTPCNLPSSAATLKEKSNLFYKKKFLGKLKKKMIEKENQFPGLVDLELLLRVDDFDTFDTYFTAKIHGFKDANDFYQSVSADNWMTQIAIPCLIINALNDPLLGPACYPVELAKFKSEIHLEMPKYGGHTGFVRKGEEFTYAEYRVLDFLAAC